ncbi:E3 ubiquitin-protein ligase Mdm2 isoform X3 [Alosa sapidissima]|uniref:E3 ubiquitin-protein ligase Mdm2 isoform X3 n=1 Tax=Alosa sapidissima TaxID=34773 RepID=UPI001C0A132F|nr:E3 ubiquitin-protein ligase Mdm2 isoform X3 [Alosa sapidissima]
MSCLKDQQIMADITADNEKLVRPNVQLQTLLKQAGADKEVFTMKEVMYYLGKYIVRKQLYDQQQQHIVRCGGDALGVVLGVQTFSVKEPRVLFAMITKNLTAVKTSATTESQPALSQQDSQSEPEVGRSEDSDSNATTSSRRRRRSSDPAGSSTQDEPRERRKRHKSDSLSLTFDDSLSWCVIGGLRGNRRSSESSDSHSNTEVYEVTIFGPEEEDEFDEDTEITEADYWKCPKCDELNPPLPRNCNRCWTLRIDWLPETNNTAAATPAIDPASDAKPLPPKPTPTDSEEGLDVPDGKRAPPRSPPTKEDPSVTAPLPSSLPDSQSSACSQPSTSSAASGSVPSSQEEAPELERFNSLEAFLPASCLEPCVICQSRPKNGCIVHGRTGHLMACYTCAKKLKNRNKLCPVCREPIQSVVLTYVS